MITKADKELWVEALKSGKYKPGTGQLKTQDGGMCCLGVICDIKGRLSDVGRVTDEKGENPSYGSAGHARYKDEYLFGLDHGTQRTLSLLNDRIRAWPIEAIEALPTVD